MQAMILAAGLGTRLQPFTNSLPKALIPVLQKPALGWLVQRLQKIGVDSIAINIHSHAHQIKNFVRQRPDYPKITLFHEPHILGTGGGLLNTRHFWQNQSFYLHNVDVFSSVDLLQVYHQHQAQQNLATLLTQDRMSQTKFLVDEENYICGIHYHGRQENCLLRNPRGNLKEFAFCGIHVIQPQIFPLIEQCGRFSIIETYLHLIEKNFPICSFNIGNAYWKDIGTIERLRMLEEDWPHHPELQECYSLGTRDSI